MSLEGWRSAAVAAIVSLSFAGIHPVSAAPSPAVASSPYLGTPVALPGTVEAENFDEGGDGVAFHDNSSGNSGGAYRATDVDLEATADSGGGYNVGWISPGEWLAYTVDVSAAGRYTLTARVAAPSAGGSFHLEVDGLDVSGPLAVPATGGWQAWQTIEKTGIQLPAGVHLLRLVMDTAGSTGAIGNVNWIRLAAAVSTPYGGAAAAVPGTIEAENFDDGGAGLAFQDNSPGNSGGAYRATDVDLEATRDAGGGYNVGWVSAGEWLNYTLEVAAAGTYTIAARVASPASGGAFHVEIDGADATGRMAVPATGGWQAWTTVQAVGVRIAAGVHVMRLVFDAAATTGAVGNFNWVRLSSEGSTPYTGTPVTLPGTIEAENFDDGRAELAYHDATPGNSGGAYRATDVDIQPAQDAGGGYNIGWISPGEWLNYTVSVPAAGTYTIAARVSSPGAGGSFHVEVDRVNATGPMAVPATGGWQAWQTIQKTGVRLPAGLHVLRVVMDAAASTGAVGNLNWLRVSADAVADFALTAPAPGSALRTTAVTFQWTGAGDEFWLDVGSAPGRADLYSSGSLGSVTQHTVPRLPLNGQALYVEVRRRVGTAVDVVSATYAAPVRRALAVVTDFSDRRLEDWTGDGIRSEADLSAQLREMEDHWSWMSHGLEKVQWEIVRVRLSRPAAPGAFSSWVEFRDAVADLVKQQVSLPDYDVNRDGVLDITWSVASMGDLSLDYVIGGASSHANVNMFVDGQASLSVRRGATANFNHEVAHLLGLPDMYGDYSTLSSLTIMSYSWDLPPGDFAAYERVALGWVSPLVVRQTTSGLWLPRASDRLAAVKVPTARPEEYFLIEYRDKPASGYGSADVDYDGLIVYHVLEGSSMWQDPPIVKLVPADGVVTAGQATDPNDFVYPGNPYWTPPLVVRAYPDASGTSAEVFRIENVSFRDGGMAFDIVLPSTR